MIDSLFHSPGGFLSRALASSPFPREVPTDADVRAGIQTFSRTFGLEPAAMIDAMLKDQTLMNLVGGEVSRATLDAMRQDPRRGNDATRRAPHVHLIVLAQLYLSLSVGASECVQATTQTA